jgi:hypothetical protein
MVAVLPNWVIRHELPLAAGPSPAAPDQSFAGARERSGQLKCERTEGQITVIDELNR